MTRFITKLLLAWRPQSLGWEGQSTLLKQIPCLKVSGTADNLINYLTSTNCQALISIFKALLCSLIIQSQNFI